MIDALNQGSRNCMEDIRKAGLPFFTSVLDEVPPLNVKRRKVEISPFVQVDFIEKEDDPEDLNEEDDLTYDDQVEEVDPENTVPTPFGHLPHSQADRILLNAGGVRLNNISRKGRVASKSRGRLFHETVFFAYLTPEK